MTSTPPARRGAYSVPPGWAAQHPVDEDTPAGLGPPAPAGPHHQPAARPATIPRAPAAGRPRGRRDPTNLTGMPRVDWAAYDRQAAHDYTTDPTWILYRVWTRIPVDGRWWARTRQHILAFLFGPRCRLLWVGISMRAMIARGIEHLADKSWRRQIHIIEVDPHVTFSTEADAEEHEEGRIRAECPVYNRQHNERAHNPGAVHRTKRILPRHIAHWRAQAGLLAAAWMTLAVPGTWLLWPDRPSFTTAAQAFTGGIMLAAVLLQAARIGRLFLRGQQLTAAQRRRIAAKYDLRNARP